jgi:hypothetical protein
MPSRHQNGQGRDESDESDDKVKMMIFVVVVVAKGYNPHVSRQRSQ